MVNRATELPVQAAPITPKIIEKIGEWGHTSASSVGKRTAFVERRMLTRQLPQEIRAETEGMPATHQPHCVLVLPVVAVPELRHVCRASEPSNHESPIICLFSVDTVRAHHC